MVHQGDVVWGMKFSEHLESSLNIAAGLLESAKDSKISCSVDSFTLVIFFFCVAVVQWDIFKRLVSYSFFHFSWYDISFICRLIYVFPTCSGAKQQHSLSEIFWELINFTFISVQNEMAAIWMHDFPSLAIQVQWPQITFPFFSAIIQGVKGAYSCFVIEALKQEDITTSLVSLGKFKIP